MRWSWLPELPARWCRWTARWTLAQWPVPYGRSARAGAGLQGLLGLASLVLGSWFSSKIRRNSLLPLGHLAATCQIETQVTKRIHQREVILSPAGNRFARLECFDLGICAGDWVLYPQSVVAVSSSVRLECCALLQAQRGLQSCVETWLRCISFGAGASVRTCFCPVYRILKIWWISHCSSLSFWNLGNLPSQGLSSSLPQDT